MKPPPLLLGTTLAFWGWQSDFLIPGVLMGLIVESARVVHPRWEFSDEDFSRVWTFCSLLFLAAGVYAFNENQGPASFGSWFQNPNFRTQGRAGLSSAKTAASIFRWLPMIFFPFLAAQLFSTRETIPLATISLILRRRAKQAKRAGKPPPAARNVNIAYPYFAGTLLAASVHAAEDSTFFWGLAVLLTWALWAQRSRRFGFVIWCGALTVAVALGFVGQRGIGQLQRYLWNINPAWFAQFTRRNVDPTQSRTALGQVGEVKTSGRIIIRVEPREGAPPVYLREASYRGYDKRAWTAGSSGADFAGVQEEFPNSASWDLLPRQTNAATVNVACYLEGFRNGSPLGLLPLPAGTWRLERLPAYVLQTNSAGAVLAEGPGLVVFDARFGLGAMIDSPPEANEDLSVPRWETNALESVITELQLRGKNLEQTLRDVSRFFNTRFSYSTWQSRPLRVTTNNTPVSRFLLETRRGHCEYFATATALLLRQLKIPTRYAVGYAVHETSGRGYVVRLRDAHAWCLVWNPDKQIWDDFDTTPASWVAEEGKRAAAFQWLQDAWTRLKFEIAKFRWGQSNVRKYLLIGIVPGLAVLLYQILFRRRRRRKKGADAERVEIFNWPGLDSEFYELEKGLAERGVPRGASEPLNEWLERVAETPGLAELRGPLREILRLHYRYRFDPLGLSEEDREVLRAETRAGLERLTRMEDPANGVRKR